ncbi:MAG: VOC family protein [Pseudomonadota bacterium]
MQPTIVPYISYQNCAAAIDFLANAFGFQVNVRFDAHDGSESHAELMYGIGSVLVGPPLDVQSRARIFVAVSDLDAHYRHAMAHGAIGVYPPEETDFGSRRYCVKDPEGHEWTFCTESQVSQPNAWPS